MTPDELKKRTQKFALDVMSVTEYLPQNRIGDILTRQIVRSATSVGANYRAACKARSKADFISKIGIVEEEVDETKYWLEIIRAKRMLDDNQCIPLIREAEELTAIFAASAIRAKQNR